jgi:hypothetical protein
MLDPFLVMVVDGEVQADIGPVGVVVVLKLLSHSFHDQGDHLRMGV